jgi:hypothetical protein
MIVTLLFIAACAVIMGVGRALLKTEDAELKDQLRRIEHGKDDKGPWLN